MACARESPSYPSYRALRPAAWCAQHILPQPSPRWGRIAVDEGTEGQGRGSLSWERAATDSPGVSSVTQGGGWGGNGQELESHPPQTQSRATGSLLPQGREPGEAVAGAPLGFGGGMTSLGWRGRLTLEECGS